eukprot:TRINITY_DN1529_c0_g1_i1.p2 TRINITY_DN1529_c0_g1~~TRINITY_DN1529_c0_g1_i1.p2  ORF type:complete len:129 (+),score=28.25 TRINITY_DN1529_c0_g1_i1:682-1068(+)
MTDQFIESFKNLSEEDYNDCWCEKSVPAVARNPLKIEMIDDDTYKYKNSKKQFGSFEEVKKFAIKKYNEIKWVDIAKCEKAIRNAALRREKMEIRIHTWNNEDMYKDDKEYSGHSFEIRKAVLLKQAL